MHTSPDVSQECYPSLSFSTKRINTGVTVQFNTSNILPTSLNRILFRPRKVTKLPSLPPFLPVGFVEIVLTNASSGADSKFERPLVYLGPFSVSPVLVSFFILFDFLGFSRYFFLYTELILRVTF